MPKTKDRRRYTGPVIAGPMRPPTEEGPGCEGCGDPKQDSDLIYRVSNGDWWHDLCYETGELWIFAKRFGLIGRFVRWLYNFKTARRWLF